MNGAAAAKANREPAEAAPWRSQRCCGTGWTTVRRKRAACPSRQTINAHAQHQGSAAPAEARLAGVSDWPAARKLATKEIDRPHQRDQHQPEWVIVRQAA